MAKKKNVEARVVEAKDKMYELMIVLKPDMLEAAVEKKLKEFEGFLSENGGTVDFKEIWGKQKLAYKIKHFTEGTYVVYNLTLSTPFLKELDNNMRIDNDLLRYLVTTLKDGYIYSKFEEEVEEGKVPDAVKQKPVRREDSRSAPVTPRKADTPKPKEKKEPTKEVDKNLDAKLDQILNDDKL